MFLILFKSVPVTEIAYTNFIFICIMNHLNNYLKSTETEMFADLLSYYIKGEQTYGNNSVKTTIKFGTNCWDRSASFFVQHACIILSSCT